MINVEDHAAHCRMAREIILIFTNFDGLRLRGSACFRAQVTPEYLSARHYS